VLLFLVSCSKSPTAPGSSSAVTVSLTWDSVADLDLHVVEPGGTEIYWYNPTSTAGGKLDMDAHNPCTGSASGAAENISWANSAPSGTYTVRVDLYESCGSPQVVTNYTVTVMNGASSTYKGTLTGDGDVGADGAGTLVTTFRH
jgi:uncharacterized protein YfaP (DUF2135 family)